MSYRSLMFSLLLLTQCASGRTHRELIDGSGKGETQPGGSELPPPTGQNLMPNLQFADDESPNKTENPKDTPADTSSAKELAPPGHAKQSGAPRMDDVHDGKPKMEKKPKKKSPEGVDSNSEHEKEKHHTMHHPAHEKKDHHDGHETTDHHDAEEHGMKKSEKEKRRHKERHSKEHSGESKLKDETHHSGERHGHKDDMFKDHKRHESHPAGSVPELERWSRNQGPPSGMTQDLIYLLKREDKRPHEKLKGVMTWLRAQQPEDIDALWPDFNKSLLHAIQENKSFATRPLLRGGKEKPLDSTEDTYGHETAHSDESGAPSNTTPIIGALCGSCVVLLVYLVYFSKNRGDAARAPLMSSLDGYNDSLERQLR